MSRPLTRVLIANRGEIALRVIRTVQALGLEAVAIHSEVDAKAPHVLAADRAVALRGVTPGESYLDQAQVLAAVAESGADAVHPGYGFLSENASFAAALEERGVTFVGPPMSAVEAMGDKAAAREVAMRAGVSPVPGYEGADDDDALIAASGAIGYPLLVKATMGGGGKGMRRVSSPDELRGAIAAARREAQSAFGSGKLLLERYVHPARHIEVQVFADQHGTVIPLLERECSLQRRHQKVLEECPSATVSPELRAKLGEAAVKLARAVGYVGAGTVEFLAEEDGSFWFLEMNTRLQVEHPVTEAVLGLDLVALQLSVAAGERLDPELGQLEPRGHALEVRLYAEDPRAGWLPQAGDLHALSLPEGPGLRVDAGVRSGDVITPHYDPMIGKVIAHGATREAARQRLLAALAQTAVAGLPSNRDALVAILQHEEFRAGQTFTDSLEGWDLALGGPDDQPPHEVLALAAVAMQLERTGGSGGARGEGDGDGDRWSPFDRLGAFRLIDGTCREASS